MCCALTQSTFFQKLVFLVPGKKHPWGAVIFPLSFVLIYDLLFCVLQKTIDKLPDKILMHIFSYLPHKELCRIATVCRKWRMIAYDSKLWSRVSLRPEFSKLNVSNIEGKWLLSRRSVIFLQHWSAAMFHHSMFFGTLLSSSWTAPQPRPGQPKIPARRYVEQCLFSALLALIGVRFSTSLRYIELPCDLITPPILHELANKVSFLFYHFAQNAKCHKWLRFFSVVSFFVFQIKKLTVNRKQWAQSELKFPVCWAWWLVFFSRTVPELALHDAGFLPRDAASRLQRPERLSRQSAQPDHLSVRGSSFWAAQQQNPSTEPWTHQMQRETQAVSPRLQRWLE